MNDETEQPLTYEQILTELALLTRRAWELAQEQNRAIDAAKLAMATLTVDRLRTDLALEKKG